MYSAAFLSIENLNNFFKFHYPELSDENILNKINEYLKKIRSGERSFDNTITISKDKNIIWNFTIFLDGGNTYGISTPNHFLDSALTTLDWHKATILIQNRLLNLKPDKASLRFVKKVMTKNLGLALEKINFKKKNERIEFKSDLVNLPNDTGTPLLWKALETDGIDLEFAGGIMDLCTVGDPNSDPAEKAIHFLKTDLIDPDYQSKPEAIQIGYLNEKPVAFVFAQVDPTSRWSRITYMGLIPEMRKKGLGKWVHRHGFEMMRQQGGKQYFGGTTTDNQLMLATFRAHGCEEYKALEEWAFTP